MARIWGSVGQVVPAATTLTTAYTVPALKHAVVSVLAVNQGAVATIRISIARAGAANASNQYIVYDHSLATAVEYSTIKITLGAGDVLRVYASTANVSFNVNGVEEDD